MNVSSPSTAAAGRTAGSTTCQKTRMVWQPSTREASISSFGTEATMYCRIRNTPNAETSERRDHRLQVVDPAQVLHLDVERDHAELHRDEQRRDDDEHQHLVAAELELREGEAGERAEEDDRDASPPCDDRRVDQRRPEVDVDLARVEDARRCCAELAARASSPAGSRRSPSCRARRRRTTSRAGRPRQIATTSRKRYVNGPARLEAPRQRRRRRRRAGVAVRPSPSTTSPPT